MAVTMLRQRALILMQQAILRAIQVAGAAATEARTLGARGYDRHLRTWQSFRNLGARAWHRQAPLFQAARRIPPRTLALVALGLVSTILASWSVKSFNSPDRPAETRESIAAPPSPDVVAEQTAQSRDGDASSGRIPEPGPTADTGAVLDSSQALTLAVASPGGAVAAEPASEADGARTPAPSQSATRPSNRSSRSGQAVERAVQPRGRKPVAGARNDARVLPASNVYLGALTIVSVPEGASVFVNRRPVGSTPLALDDLPIGSHVIRIEAEGYQRWSAAVRVVAAQRTRIRAELHPTTNR